MELEVRRRWVRLRLSAPHGPHPTTDVDPPPGEPPTPERPLDVVLTDDRRRRRTPSAGSSVVQVPLGRDGSPRWLRLPEDADAFLAEALADLPTTRIGLYPEVGVRLPVFVPPEDPLGADLDWAPHLARLLPGVAPERLAVVRERGARVRPRDFRLPLHLLMVGTTGRRVQQQMEIASSWFRMDGVISWRLVSDLRSPTDGTTVGSGTAVGTVGQDIVVVGARDIALLPPASPAHRLVVVLGEDRGALTPVASARSVIRLSGPGDAPAVVALLENLAHDVPLHEAALSLPPEITVDVGAIESSPAALHDLRVSDVYGQVVATGRDLATSVTRPHSPSVLTSVMEAIDQLDLTFDRETGGLGPLARTRLDLEEAATWLEHSAAARPPPPDDTGGDSGDAPDEATPPPARALDLMLRRGDDALLPAGTSRLGPAAPYVALAESLQAGARYLLEFQIGALHPTSLIVGARPPIDPLLPDRERGHDLEVVLHQGRFEVSGPTVLPLHLPPRGASARREFLIRAPARTGPASLRVSVTLDNHVLQTYQLRSLIEARSTVTSGQVTAFTLDSASTAAFANLDDLAPRALSLIANTDVDGHRVYLKGTGATAELPLTEAFTAAAITPLRSTLTEASRSPSAQAQDAALRDLATRGSGAFIGLFTRARSEEAQTVLRTVQRGDNLAIEIRRADADQSVPWTMLYDRWLPADPASVPLCWGGDEAGPCAHDADSRDIICARGFWGVRHVVEERMPGEGDAITVVGGDGASLLLARGVHDGHTDGLATDLAGFGAVVELTRSDNLLDHLWPDPNRPPVVALLGHHDDATGGLDCGTAEGWVTAHMVGQQVVQAGGWSKPNSLVLLLACDAGALRPDQLTAHVLSLISAHAAAVVAPECVIDTHLGRAMASGLLRRLLAGPGAQPAVSLGTALQETRAELMRTQRSIGPLAFVAFGLAETRL